MWKIKKAYATNTRYMGVVGLIIHFEDYVDIYHLDFEEYGIDGFYSVSNINKIELDDKINRTIGGLGGELIEIDILEAEFLIKSSYDISDDYSYELDIDHNYIENIEHKLSDEGIEKLYLKICVDLINSYEFINYFLMRVIANDKKMIEYLSVDLGELNIIDVPSTLLKNEIKELEDGSFFCKSLIDYENRYMQITFKIEIEGSKVTNIKFIEKMYISSIEASLILNKKEYILIYTVENNKVETGFYNDNKLMRSYYENGTLYTRYNPNNRHVAKDTYFLSEDLFGIFYFTDSGQLVISSFKSENVDKIITELKKYEGLNLDGDFEVDKSLIYNFITSQYDDFYDFLNIK